MPVAYRFASPNADVQRFEGRTLEAVCRLLDVERDDLLEYVPDARAKRGRP